MKKKCNESKAWRKKCKKCKALEIAKMRREIGLILASSCHTLDYKLSLSLFLSFTDFLGGRRRLQEHYKTRENPYNSLKNLQALSPISPPFLAEPWGSIYRLQRRRLQNPDRWIKSLAQRPDSCRGSAARAAFPRQNLGRCASEFCCGSVTVCWPRGSSRISGYMRGWLQILG